MNDVQTPKNQWPVYVENLVKWALLALLGIVSYFLQKTTAEYENTIRQQNARIELLQNSLNTLQMRDGTNSQTSIYIQERIRGLEVGREENRERIEQLEKQMIKITR